MIECRGSCEDECDDVALSSRSLGDLVIERGGQPVRGLVSTTWRSGSTFLGDILHSHPGTYYHFEPLMHFGIVQVSMAATELGGL